MADPIAQAKALAKVASANVSLPADFDIEAAIATDQVPGLRPLQAELEANLKRFNVLVLHRRFGKTVLAIRYLIKRALLCPFDDGRYAYFAPTYSQAEDIAWSYLVSFTESIPGVVVEKSKLAVWLPTLRGSKARIRLYGVDSPKQRLRGLYLDGCVEDEFAQFPPSVWTEQVRPMLSDAERAGVDAEGIRNQWDIKIATPQGRNYFYTLYQRAQLWEAGEPVILKDGEGHEKPIFRDDYFAARYPASATGVLDAQELLAALHDQGQAKYDQEYECSFDAAVEGSIFTRQLEELRRGGRITSIPINPLIPVDTGWDLGWDDATAIWFCQNIGGQPRIIDYYENSGFPLKHYAEVLAEKSKTHGYRYGRHYLPHDVAFTDVGSGHSRRSILQEAGVRVTTVKRHSPWDGIAAVQAFLPRCYFDASRCAEGLDRLALYRRVFDEKRQVYREAPNHDWASHGADAMRSLAMGLRAFRPMSKDHIDPNTVTSAELEPS